MKPEVLLELLESAAEKLQVRVSYEPLQSAVVHGGLCPEVVHLIPGAGHWVAYEAADAFNAKLLEVLK